MGSRRQMGFGLLDPEPSVRTRFGAGPCVASPASSSPRQRSTKPSKGHTRATSPLQGHVARVEVIDVSKLSGDTIRFGATATLVDEDSGEKKVWQIVGEPEADANKGKISVTSPVARALIGKNKGDTVEVEAPGGVKSYNIRKVEWLND
jgi:transcription elongation factor GreA